MIYKKENDQQVRKFTEYKSLFSKAGLTIFKTQGPKEAHKDHLPVMIWAVY